MTLSQPLVTFILNQFDAERRMDFGESYTFLTCFGVKYSYGIKHLEGYHDHRNCTRTSCA